MPCTPLAAAADAILGQCAHACEAVDDHAFTTESTTVRGGTIGKHIRHALDHYRALLDTREGPVDYDHRTRGVTIESDRAAARSEIARMRTKIAALDAGDLDRGVTIRVMLSGEGDTTDLPTTLGRELWFCAHHAIHHNAMIKAIAHEFGAAFDQGFGTAPSTLNYLRTA